MKPTTWRPCWAGNPYPRPGHRPGQNGRRAAVRGGLLSSWAAARTAATGVFVKEPDGIRTQAYDPAKLADPSLIIYHPVRQMGRGLIVTNGDQT